MFCTFDQFSSRLVMSFANNIPRTHTRDAATLQCLRFFERVIHNGTSAFFFHDYALIPVEINPLTETVFGTSVADQKRAHGHDEQGHPDDGAFVIVAKLRRGIFQVILFTVVLTERFDRVPAFAHFGRHVVHGGRTVFARHVCDVRHKYERRYA